MGYSATFYRDTWAEIDLDCISENVKNMKLHIGDDREVIAVVKADGYGHSAYHVAITALESGATTLAVALLDEAIQLRKQGIQAPILVMGWIRAENVNVAAKYNIIVTAFQVAWFEKAIASLSKELRLSFHLKLDTGMGRIGLKEKSEADQIIALLRSDPRFCLNGIFTHFATADEKVEDYFHVQYRKFIEMIEWFKKEGFSPSMIHCANSAAGLRFPHRAFNAVRFGISMYGLSPSEEIKAELPFQLKQAFSLKSRLVHVKKLIKGEKVSYGGTYEASGEEWIGTVPIGYADGWLRKLSGSEIIVEGKRCPIVGRICMDQLMVRLPEYMPVGSLVTLIGRQANDEITIDDIANKLETINYEVPCIISYRVPRMIFRKRRIIEVKHFFEKS